MAEDTCEGGQRGSQRGPGAQDEEVTAALRLLRRIRQQLLGAVVVVKVVVEDTGLKTRSTSRSPCWAAWLRT